jgi:hypothetical protein
LPQWGTCGEKSQLQKSQLQKSQLQKSQLQKSQLQKYFTRPKLKMGKTKECKILHFEFGRVN